MRKSLTQRTDNASKTKIILIFAAVVIVGGGAWFIKHLPVWKLEHQATGELNRIQTRRNPNDLRLRAISSAMFALEKAQMPSAELYFGMSSSALNKVIPDLLRDKYPEVKEASVTPGHQEIVVHVNFSLYENKLDARVTGKADVHATADIANGALLMTPSFSSVEIKSVSLKHLGEVKTIIPPLNFLLKSFTDRLSTFLSQESNQIPISTVRALTPKDVLGDEAFYNLSGNTINIATAVGTSAMFIDEEGIHIVANLVNLTPDVYKEVIDKFRLNPPKANTTFTSKEIAVFSQCSARPRIHTQDEQKDYEQFRSICSQLSSLGNLMSLRPSEAPNVDQYEALRQSFRNRVKELGGEDGDPSLWSSTAIHISKRFIAASLNSFAGDPHYSGSYRPAAIPFAFRQEIRSEKAADLKCDAIGCNPDYSQCEPHWNCEGRGCPSDCAWYDVGCHSWKPVCEGLKAAEKGGCELDKGRFRAQCNVTKQAEKTECEGRKAACKVNQEWLRTWSETQIGLAEVNGNVQRLAVGFETQKVDIDNTLEQFRVVSVSSAVADVVASVKFTPRDFGNLACIGQWQGDVRGEVSLAPDQFTILARLQTASPEGDDLVLAYASEPLPVVLKFSPPPFQAVLDHNPQLYVQCTGGVIGKLFGAGMKDTFNYTIPPRTVKIRIPKSDFVFLGTTFYLRPSQDRKSNTVVLNMSSPRWKL